MYWLGSFRVFYCQNNFHINNQLICNWSLWALGKIILIWIYLPRISTHRNVFYGVLSYLFLSALSWSSYLLLMVKLGAAPVVCWPGIYPREMALKLYLAWEWKTIVSPGSALSFQFGDVLGGGVSLSLVCGYFWGSPRVHGPMYTPSIAWSPREKFFLPPTSTVLFSNRDTVVMNKI